jgi:hypothetical protein
LDQLATYRIRLDLFVDSGRNVDDINSVLTEGFHIGGAVGAANGLAVGLKLLFCCEKVHTIG